MSLRTRPLTGLPSWPITLLAGVEKSGKTLGAVTASASDLVHRTFLVTVGEDQPDEYGQVPGQRVELVEHAGTLADVMGVLLEAAAEPPGPNGEPNLIVLDSATRLWDLIMDSCQAISVDRARRKGNAAPDKMSPDLWNLAADRWQDVMDCLRAHRGPSILTARLDLVAVFDNAGNITREKRWKPQCHKSLPYDVGAIIELRESARPGHPAPAVLRGVRSLALSADAVDGEGAVRFPAGLTLDALWRGLGLTAHRDAIGPRSHAPLVRVPEQVEQTPAQRQHAAATAASAAPAPVRERAPAPSPEKVAWLVDVIRSAPSMASMCVQLQTQGLARLNGRGVWLFHDRLAEIDVVTDLGECTARELIDVMSDRLPAEDPTPAPAPVPTRPADRGLLQSQPVPADGGS